MDSGRGELFKLKKILPAHLKNSYFNLMKKQTLLFIVCLCALTGRGYSQDLEKMLAEETPAETEYTTATFKGTRLINFHTLETPGPRTLEYRISHRFGTVGSGAENFYGLDGGASIRMGLEYSHNGRITFGLGRSNIEKTLDAYGKARLLRQTTNNKMPLSMTLVSSVFCTTQKDANKAVNGFDRYQYFSSRLSYAHQLIIGRKFTESFSLQIAPTLIHLNLVEKASDKNDIICLASAARIKLSKRVALTAEYGLRLNEYSSNRYYNSFGLGIDIETGGHVFQMHITNSQGMIENQYLAFSNTDWSFKNPGIRIGFNISRVFSL
ncbi:MAG: hypothetical protein RLZZ46_46 [Bacteroidota bacterium]|jgi:hypothetical protein